MKKLRSRQKMTSPAQASQVESPPSLTPGPVPVLPQPGRSLQRVCAAFNATPRHVPRQRQTAAFFKLSNISQTLQGAPNCRTSTGFPSSSTDSLDEVALRTVAVCGPKFIPGVGDRLPNEPAVLGVGGLQTIFVFLFKIICIFSNFL